METMKTCKNCNAILQEGSAFCSNCGAKVEASPEAAPASEPDKVFCTECGTELSENSAFCPYCGKPVKKESPAAAGVKDKTGSPKKTFPKAIYFGIAALVIVIILIAAFVIKGKSPDSKLLLYAKDNELQIMKMTDLKPVEITDRLVADDYGAISADEFSYLSFYICMSDDKRFVFYPDHTGYDVTYYWRDLKANQTKNDAATKVDSEIIEMPYLTSDGNYFFYIKGDDDRLYVYERKSGDKKRLDDGVTGFYVNETGDYIIYSTYVNDESNIYEMSLKNLNGEKNKIDSNSYIAEVFIKDKALYYTKDNNLYFKEFGKDKVKVASDVNRLISAVDKNSVYYLKSEEVTRKLSELITDDMAADDRNIVEPSYPDYPEMPESPSLSDYTVRVWVDDYWGYEWNPETNNWGYYNEDIDYDAYYEAYAQYETEYSNWEEEYNRLEEEYEAAYSLYQEKLFRDELRDALDSDFNAVVYNKYSLYYWDKGTETLVASEIALTDYYNYYLAVSQDKPLVVYQKYNTSSGSNLKLSDLLEESYGFYVDSIIYDLQNRITESRNVSEDIYIAVKNKESIIECKNPVNWSVDAHGTVYYLDDYSYDDGHGDLTSLSLSGDSVGKPVKIDEDVVSYSIGNNNNNIYYFKDVKNGTGDLYTNGRMIASDVYTLSLYNFEGTDTLLYYKDYSDKSYYGTLTILQKNKEVKIADDVAYFVPVDEKNIAYLTDYNYDREKGDLFLYSTGKKPRQIDMDVSALIWNKDMIWGNYYWPMY